MPGHLATASRHLAAASGNIFAMASRTIILPLIPLKSAIIYIFNSMGMPVPTWFPGRKLLLMSLLMQSGQSQSVGLLVYLLLVLL